MPVNMLKMISDRATLGSVYELFYETGLKDNSGLVKKLGALINSSTRAKGGTGVCLVVVKTRRHNGKKPEDLLKNTKSDMRCCFATSQRLSTNSETLLKLSARMMGVRSRTALPFLIPRRF